MLESLLRPTSVAIIGASDNPLKVGGTPLALLKEWGYGGRIVAVNPHSPLVQGVPTVAEIGDADVAVDLAIICVPQALALTALTQCAQARVKAAIMFTSGYAEMGAAGAQAQQALTEVAGRAGMALLGPNCLGVMSLRQRLFATFSPVARAGVPPPGAIGLVSQSGAFGAYAYTLARQSELGLSHWVTTGNEAGVQAADVIEWMAQDDETRVILAYLEGCRDGARLMRALHAARRAGKPVVITKVGRTEAGARAAMSHTASLAGSDTVFNAVFEECAAVRAYTIEEFFRYGQMFAKAPLPKSAGLAIVTVSGGVGTLMADRAEDLGLNMPAFTDAESAGLKALVPFCSTSNPIDLTGQIGAFPQLFPQATETACSSGRYGSVALFVAASCFSPKGWSNVQACVQVTSAWPDIPVAVVGTMSEEQRRELMAQGCLSYEEPTHAVEAFGVMWRYVQARNAALAHEGESRPALTLSAPLPPGALNEAQALEFLRQGRVKAAPFHVANTAGEAVQFARQLGGAVVLKVLSRDLLHKSDLGGVRLGLTSAEQVHQAFVDIQSDVARLAPHAVFEGVLVAPMIKPVIECMVGARLDPIFGPIVVFGLGGTEVEWLGRVALAVAPVSPGRVRALLARLGILKRLDGWRGGPQVDPARLIDTICGVSELAAAVAHQLVNMEVNPLMVTSQGVFAADAVVQLGAQPWSQNE